jgi:hypothetical protein
LPASDILQIAHCHAQLELPIERAARSLPCELQLGDCPSLMGTTLETSHTIHTIQMDGEMAWQATTALQGMTGDPEKITINLAMSTWSVDFLVQEGFTQPQRFHPYAIRNQLAAQAEVVSQSMVRIRWNWAAT